MSSKEKKDAINIILNPIDDEKFLQFIMDLIQAFIKDWGY